MREMVMQWGTKEFGAGSSEPAESMILSGGGQHAESLEGPPAILDIPQGKGHVLAYNFNPMHRDLNHSDYRYLWNGILNWDHLPPLAP
jgi:hypothetical protein